MTWLDEQPTDKIDAALAKYRAEGSQAKDYSGGDDRFGLWLALCDRRCTRTVGLGIFDIGDWLWRDAYDAGTSPRDAVQEALEADDIPWPV